MSSECTCIEDFSHSDLRKEVSLSWWCWMFGCNWCATNREYCDPSQVEKLSQMSKFTRQHYTMVADILANRASNNVEQAMIYVNWLANYMSEDYPKASLPEHDFNRDFALFFAAAIQEDCRTMEEFAKEFRDDNSRFDRERFLEECGYYKYLGVAAAITREHLPNYFTS